MALPFPLIFLQELEDLQAPDYIIEMYMSLFDPDADPENAEIATCIELLGKEIRTAKLKHEIETDKAYLELLRRMVKKIKNPVSDDLEVHNAYNKLVLIAHFEENPDVVRDYFCAFLRDYPDRKSC